MERRVVSRSATEAGVHVDAHADTDTRADAAREDELHVEVDVAVVGGGIIGLGIAFELCQRGRRVLVVDSGERAGQATSASAGMLAPAAESDVELPGLCEFRRYSHALYPQFVQRLEESSGVDCGLSTRGSILVAIDRDQRQELERLQQIMRDQGFEANEIDLAQAFEMEPHLSPRVVRAMFLEQDHNLDPRRVLRALRRSIERQGGRILDGARATSLDPEGVVEGSRDSGSQRGRFHVEADSIVLAAGSWSNVDLAGPSGRLPIRPIKGQVVRLHAPGLLRHVVRTPDVYLVPHSDGALVVGATVEEQGFDARPTAGGTFDLLRDAWRVLPTIYDAPLDEVAVGFRPAARDHLPIIGRWRATRLVVATGHYRNGILQAPGTAQVVSDLICDDVAHPLLEFFGPDRFDRGDGDDNDKNDSARENAGRSRPASRQTQEQ